MVRATVVIPTHTHGPLLGLAAASALRQTVTDLELFIVLDGADIATIAAAESVADSDARVRLFRHPKGLRHGEGYRHLALREARGDIVCYLCDDDLWFPDHVEYLEGLLRASDFAHSQTVVAHPGGGTDIPHIGDLADPWYRNALLGPFNFIPLSAAGHTLEAYRSLGVEWSPAPSDVWTDLFMFRKFVVAPHARLLTGGLPTVLHFPSPQRLGMSLDARLAELESWVHALEMPDAWNRLRLKGIDLLNACAARLQRDATLLEADLRRVQVQLAESDRAAADLAARHAADGTELAAAITQIDHLTAELTAIRRSVAYRAGRRLADMPVIGRLARLVGRALAGSSDL